MTKTNDPKEETEIIATQFDPNECITEDSWVNTAIALGLDKEAE